MKKTIIICIILAAVTIAVIAFIEMRKKKKALIPEPNAIGSSNASKGLPSKEPKIGAAFQKFIDENKPEGASEGDKPSSRVKPKIVF